MKRIHHVGYWQLFPIFNGQLQARDIIRFLKYAAGQNMKNRRMMIGY